MLASGNGNVYYTDMIKPLSLFVAAAVSSLACFAGDISQAISSGDFWTGSIPDTKNKYFVGARYSPVDAQTWRMAPGALTFGSLQAGEVLVNWGEEGVNSLRLMVYNKGDDGVLDQDAYFEQLDAAVAALTEISGVEPKKQRADVKKTGVKTETWLWSWEGGAARLDAGFSGKRSKGKRPSRSKKKSTTEEFEAEFIRVDIGPDEEAIALGGARDKVSRKDIKGSIQKDEEGNVWLEGVPMVDQGQKGYCVPATLARVFAFYGMDGVDQHALAALCDSSADGGTSNLDMEQAMSAICKKFPVKFTVLENYHDTVSALIPAYNKVASRKGKSSLSPMADPIGSADPALLREVRAGKKSQVKKWMAAIKKSVDSGCPVVWSTTLGLYPETPAIPQARGGHMRLIIGYNMQEQTIFYTDSWGAGHEKKVMKAANALSMSNGRYTIKLK